MLRHNCFLMTAWAKTNLCMKHNDLSELCLPFFMPRINHALPVSGIVDDAMRLDVNCEPFAELFKDPIFAFTSSI